MFALLRSLFLAAGLLIALTSTAQADPGAKPSSAALETRTEALVQLCSAQLHLTAAQADVMRYYLKAEFTTLQAHLAAGIITSTEMAAAGRAKLDELAFNILDINQIVAYKQLIQSSGAYPVMRSLALLN